MTNKSWLFELFKMRDYDLVTNQVRANFIDSFSNKGFWLVLGTCVVYIFRTVTICRWRAPNPYSSFMLFSPYHFWFELHLKPRRLVLIWYEKFSDLYRSMFIRYGWIFRNDCICHFLFANIPLLHFDYNA